MRSTLFIIAAFAGLSAFGTVCKMGKMERKVEVATTDAEKKVPCEVKYTRDGEEKSLYNAQVDASYCDKKAEELVAKLTSQGWQCDSAAAPAHEAASPEKTAAPVEEKKAEPAPAPEKKK